MRNDEMLIGLGDSVEFELRLAETIAWCEPRIRIDDPKESLRTDALRPSPMNYGRTSVNYVINLRSSYLRDQELTPIRSSTECAGGRLLVYFPDEDLFDGAAELQSKGFFDPHNCPPWDTWVGFYQDTWLTRGSHRQYLISYVPQALIELANDGIEVNPEECIAWLANSKTALSQQLYERGLLI